MAMNAWERGQVTLCYYLPEPGRLWRESQILGLVGALIRSMGRGGLASLTRREYGESARRHATAAVNTWSINQSTGSTRRLSAQAQQILLR